MAIKSRNISPNRNLARSIISLIFVIIWAGLFIYLSFSGYKLFPSNETLELVVHILIVVLMVMSLIFNIVFFVKWKNASNLIRFDYATFSLVKNIRSEKAFLSYVDQHMKRHPKHKDVIIVFTVTKFKKTVFTRYGYERGAEVLEVVYRAFNPMQKKFPHSTYGYDYNENFLVFLPNSDLQAVKQYVNTISTEINDRLFAENNDVKFISDFGVSFSKDENNENLSSTSMLQRALIASDHGRLETELGSLTVYEPNMFEKNKRNVQLGVEIEKGLELSQFELHYQPKFDIKLGRFAGAEALVRWRHPELGLLSPANFILFAEQSDLIIKLDHYVLEKVCEQLDDWRGKGQRLLPVSINISKKTLFTGNIVNHIIRVTEKYNINPMLLEIEIVESPSLQDILLLLSIVKKFKALNIKIAIDDFGTGYSSLSYIKKIPFDVIKIDKAFLDDVDIDQKSRLVIKNIVDLAHILDAYVVIEGVQDEKQVEMLKEMGADAIQGYFYSRPLPAAQYQEFLEDNLFEYKAKVARRRKK
ncbi:MAG: EAL domain-containing protein [Bacilli bacterium]